MSDLRSMLMQDETLRLKPYLDTKGRITIGVGRCLDTAGISAQEAVYLLENDITRSRAAAATFPWFPGLDPVRQDVVTAMVFNMGLSGFCEFRLMIAAIQKQDFSAAATEMLGSQWATQVGDRAVRLAGMMHSGQYPK